MIILRLQISIECNHAHQLKISNNTKKQDRLHVEFYLLMQQNARFITNYFFKTYFLLNKTFDGTQTKKAAWLKLRSGKRNGEGGHPHTKYDKYPRYVFAFYVLVL